MRVVELPIAALLGGSGNGKFDFVAKWRGDHGTAVGLCTASLIAKEWVITAGHCATRMLKHEPVRVTVEFAEGGAVKRGVTHCIKCDEGCGLDVAICHLTLPVGHINPVRLNSDHYTIDGDHGRCVTCVGTYDGIHATGPKKLEYEANGAHLYVSNAGGSGMHAGDSGGAWVIESRNATTNTSFYVLAGVIHGGQGSGAHKRGVAGQLGYPMLRSFIAKHVNSTTWVSANALKPL